MDETAKVKMLEVLRNRAEEFLSLIENMELPPEAQEKVNQSVAAIESQLDKDVPDLGALKDNLLMLQRIIEIDIMPLLIVH